MVTDLAVAVAIAYCNYSRIISFTHYRYLMRLKRLASAASAPSPHRPSTFHFLPCTAVTARTWSASKALPTPETSKVPKHRPAEIQRSVCSTTSLDLTNSRLEILLPLQSQQIFLVVACDHLRPGSITRASANSLARSDPKKHTRAPK